MRPDEFLALRARVAELEDLLRQAVESIERSLVEKRALRARVAKLEAALKPFAAVAEYEDNRSWEDMDGVVHEGGHADDDEYWSVFYRGIRAKHFRAARAVLMESGNAA